MIKAEDLRIGDLVRVNCDCEFPKGTVCTVSEIGTIKIVEERKGCVSLIPLNGNDDSCQDVWCSDIEGIPLTPEILEKNGWDSDVVIPALYTLYTNETHQLEVECHSYSEWRYVTFNCAAINRVKYVHELQHILWALGKDANIKI